MSPADLSGVPEKVQKTEQTLVWFIQDVLRGSWFRRLVFLLVFFSVLANPSVIIRAVWFFAVKLPWWYGGVYWVVSGLLLLVTLVVGVRTLPRRPAVTPPVDPGAVRGLLPFNPEDSELFARLERGVELQRVLAALRDPNFRFGLLFGLSGTGKTSFLRAGVLRQLRESKIPAVYVEVSNEDPLRSIQREVARQGQSVLSGVLLLDQFEQFFVHQRAAEQRRPLIDALDGWYRGDSGVRVLISIREEDLGQMKEIQDRLDYKLSNQNFLKLSKFSVEQTVNVLGVLCEK